MKHLGERFYDFVPINAIISQDVETGAEDIEQSLLELFPLSYLHLLISGKLLCAWLFRRPPKSYRKHPRWWYNCNVGLTALQRLSAFQQCPSAQHRFPLWHAASHSSLLLRPRALLGVREPFCCLLNSQRSRREAFAVLFFKVLAWPC